MKASICGSVPMVTRAPVLERWKRRSNGDIPMPHELGDCLIGTPVSKKYEIAMRLGIRKMQSRKLGGQASALATIRRRQSARNSLSPRLARAPRTANMFGVVMRAAEISSMTSGRAIRSRYRTRPCRGAWRMSATRRHALAP